MTTKQKKHYNKLYSKIWRKLNIPTPLLQDCGELCSKNCCSGSEGDGMLLFPYEEILYENMEHSWFQLKDSNIILDNGKIIQLLVCDGTCPRQYRPLSCRIFPLIPYINEMGRVDFRLDLRGLGICPLVFQPQDNPLQEGFIEKIYLAFPPLLKEPDIVKFIEILSEQYDETVAFLEKFQAPSL